jgi:putative DNA primase/helicase
VRPAADQAADVSRLSVLELIKSSDDEYLNLIEPMWPTITRELGLALFARIVDQFSALLKNIEIFKDECARRVRSLRGGDQVGTLLAGAFLMDHDGPANRDEVCAWLDDRIADWGDHANFSATIAGNDESDEIRCLSSILSIQTDVNVEGEIYQSRDDESTKVRSVRARRTLAQLIEIIRGLREDSITNADAHHLLAMHGLRVENDESGAVRLWVANRNSELSRHLAHQPWGRDSWKVFLRRIEGATTSENGRKFAGVQNRYISLPIECATREFYCPTCGAGPNHSDAASCSHCETSFAVPF